MTEPIARSEEITLPGGPKRSKKPKKRKWMRVMMSPGVKHGYQRRTSAAFSRSLFRPVDQEPRAFLSDRGDIGSCRRACHNPSMSTYVGQYAYSGAAPEHHHGYLLPAALRALDAAGEKRIFEIGCGNGAVAAELTRRGYDVTGVDPSASGIHHAKAAHPDLKLFAGSAYDDLASLYGTFRTVMSLEVIEHVSDPRAFVRAARSLLGPGGTFILSTPFHGYWKNLALALTGKMDEHFTALWDGGHIKFWSEATLSELLTESGFIDIRFVRVGRIPALAKSMIAIARKA
jgi:2-polyprenyl-3-methyl-5-hydroxy-6-metoxy-1,4-benzoquinol methylase